MSIKAKSPSLHSPQSSSPITPKTNKGSHKFPNLEADENILIKACCPNCRYIFQIVNENKLNVIKNRIQRLAPIVEEKGSVMSSTGNYERPGYSEKRNRTPGFTPETSPKSKKVVDNQKNTKNISNVIGNPVKVLERKEEPQEDSLGIKQDIKLMKKYLREVSKGKQKQIKSHNISLDDDYLPHNATTLEGKNGLNPNKMGIENFSSIPQKRIEISRKCTHCNSGSVEIETAITAAKAHLLQTQLLLISPFVQKDTSTPSYIKCLQQIKTPQ